MNPGGFASRRFPVGLALAVQGSFSTDWEKSVEGKSLQSFGPPFTPWLEAGMGIQSCKFRKPGIPGERPPLRSHLLPGTPSVFVGPSVSALGSGTKGSGRESRSHIVLG